MATGYYIRQFDKTSCGGTVQEATSKMIMHGQPDAREFDAVSCGVDGKLYQIVGAIPHMESGGRGLAGTLHSHSSCPCRATIQHSLGAATYTITDPWQGPAPDSPAKRASTFTSTSTSPNTHASQPDSDIEEEEEEVEQEQLITLRIGVFFDGTGNNQANSETVAGCMARDVGLQDQSEDIRQFCATYGYGVDGSTPDNSYGNDTSNVARLYELYVDRADVSLGPEDEEASLKVYLEGIGTVSGGDDARYGQATGRWRTGVLARVEQSPRLILRRLTLFKDNNPDIKIKRLEVDVFGFSRGAAAARHFANDLLRANDSHLAKTLSAANDVFADGFAW
ncbi:MAG: PAAR domain-containing protein [Pseudomonas sp.]|uniref:PAAR domain-containing protein n=1 Tax=Pseudomonas sp. TaxID=306 RepID=UPI003D6F4DAC